MGKLKHYRIVFRNKTYRIDRRIRSRSLKNLIEKYKKEPAAENILPIKLINPLNSAGNLC